MKFKCTFYFLPSPPLYTHTHTHPPTGKPLDQWLTENEDRADVRDRQLVLQQVINTLAAIHTVGNEDLLSLWGAFMGKLTQLCKLYLKW